MNGAINLVELLLKSGVIQAPKLAKGIEQYSAIQSDVSNVRNYALDTKFQDRFRAFYRLRGGPEWRRVFFEIMHLHRRTPLSFDEALGAMANRLRRCEASFSSKLVATLNPELPVVDALVLRVMRKHLMERGFDNGEWKLLRAGSLEIRLERAIKVYNCLVLTMARILEVPRCGELINLFDSSHPGHPLTNIKKLDLMLWCYGAGLPKR